MEVSAGHASELNGRTIVGAFACLVGQMFGSSLLTGAALPLLLVPMTAEFGWSATRFSIAFSCMMICGALSGPFIGRAIDRIGTRPVILGGTVLVGLTTLSLAAADQRLWLFCLGHALLGIFGTTALGYVKIIGALFVRNRAKALAVFGVEAALAGSVAPLLIAAVLAAEGWRGVYLALGAIILCAVPLLFVLLPRDRQTAQDPAVSVHGGDDTPPREAFRSGAMWLLVAAAVFGAAPRLGFMAYIVPFLGQHGFGTASAAGAIACITAAGLAGSLTAGVLMDRFPTPRIAVPIQVVGLLSVALLPLLGTVLTGWSGLAAISLLFGFTSQAHLPLMSYFLSRFFGLAHFGQIYGMAVAVVAIGIGLITPAIGAVIENGPGFAGAIGIMALGLVLSIAFFLRLATIRPTI